MIWVEIIFLIERLSMKMLETTDFITDFLFNIILPFLCSSAAEAVKQQHRKPLFNME